jgi:hypothetical protein
MAENTVATDLTLGRLNAAQTGKLVEFARGLQQAAVEALGTTLDKKLEISGVTPKVEAAGAVPAEFSGMFVTVDIEVRLKDGATVPALMIVGEDESAALFNVDGAGDDDYKSKLE